jgi:hypothetical protein
MVSTQGGAQSLLPRDLEDLKLAADYSADYVSVPFVRSAADVQQVRACASRSACVCVRACVFASSASVCSVAGECRCCWLGWCQQKANERDRA